MEIKETISNTLSKAFELILNQKLKLDDQQGADFNQIDEKVIQLSFTDLEQTFFIIYQSSQSSLQPETTGNFIVQTHLLGQADSQLQTTLLDWISHKTTAKKDDEIGRYFINAIYNIAIDWEEAISKYTGDFIAFKLGNTLRQGQEKIKSSQQKVGKIIEEYLHFEIDLLPTKLQVNSFKKQVQQTATAVEELEKRIQNIHK
jgi:ubiquinone biosynthesis protein UbiJ